MKQFLRGAAAAIVILAAIYFKNAAIAVFGISLIALANAPVSSVK